MSDVNAVDPLLEVNDVLEMDEEDNELIQKLEEIKEFLMGLIDPTNSSFKFLNAQNIDKKFLKEKLDKNREKINEFNQIIEDIKENYPKTTKYARNFIKGNVNYIRAFHEFIINRDLSEEYIIKNVDLIGLYLEHSKEFIKNDLFLKKDYKRELQRFYDGTAKQTFKDIENIKGKAIEALVEIQETSQIIKNIHTSSVYHNAYESYSSDAKKNRNFFFISLALTFIFIVFHGMPDIANNDPLFTSKIVGFVLYKLAIFIIGGALITYFLKQSSFYHLKAEQAYQTHLELNAFPSYVSDLDKADIISLRKDLASHYFGKNISETMHDKLSSVLQDQIKASTEVMKSASDLYKASAQANSPDKPTNPRGDRG